MHEGPPARAGRGQWSARPRRSGCRRYGTWPRRSPARLLRYRRSGCPAGPYRVRHSHSAGRRAAPEPSAWRSYRDTPGGCPRRRPTPGNATHGLVSWKPSLSECSLTVPHAAPRTLVAATPKPDEIGARDHAHYGSQHGGNREHGPASREPPLANPFHVFLAEAHSFAIPPGPHALEPEVVGDA